MVEEAGKVITCKAAVAFEPKKPMQVVDVQVAPPKAGEVRVKVIANALCHTDVYTLEGNDPEGKFPAILGHEATAVVVDIGEGVTGYKAGDLVVPCYTPECGEWNCIYCQSGKTNLCPKVRATQGNGVMPDGTSRFTTMEGETIWHFMGCSTFSEYTVLCDISLAKINPLADPYQMCLLGCGVSTGWGAVMNNPSFHGNSSVAVWGLGAVGLAVVQAAKLRGATRIYGLDINEDKFAVAKEFGCTDCFNPLKEKGAKAWLLEREKWGINFTFDCTGNVNVMQEALEASHRGFGESWVIGVAAAGQMLKTRPFHLITGRTWKGTAFGGWKSRQDVPKLVNKVLLGEMPIHKYCTHSFEGLGKVNDLVHQLHSGDCLRGVLRIQGDYQMPTAPAITVVSTVKFCGGYLKKIKHRSACNDCDMHFYIFLPEDAPKQQRGRPYAALYFLSGLTCTEENAPTKSGFAPFAKAANIAMVFPDTSPRGLTDCPEAGDSDWTYGYGAGHYCDATAEPWKKHFNMYTYVTKELPELVEKHFPVDPERKSVTGFSMGGNGALIAAIKNPGKYRSVSAFAPFVPTQSQKFAGAALPKYFGDVEEAKPYDCVELLNAGGKDVKLPPGFITYASADQFDEALARPALAEALGQNGHDIPIRLEEGYNHSFFFISTFIEEHINFHAAELHAGRPPFKL